MTITLDPITKTPQAGEIWLSVTNGEAVVVTGVISEDEVENVYFSDLANNASVAELEHFTRLHMKRVRGF